jgi:hypothetical protein
MAASALTPVQVVRAGTTDTLAAANVDGNYFANTGKEWLEIANADASPMNIVIKALVDGVSISAFRTIAVAAGARKKIGPFSPSPYNDADNRVQVTYSAVTSVTVGVFYL